MLSKHSFSDIQELRVSFYKPCGLQSYSGQHLFLFRTGVQIKPGAGRGIGQRNVAHFIS